MRYIFGTVAMTAAIIIVGYSATTLFTAAYMSSSEPWQQMLNGVGAAAVVAWEATALMLIGAAWHRGYKPVAVGAAVLLVVAMAVTLKWEMRTVIGGQADQIASRDLDAKKLHGIEEDLKWLRDRRQKLTDAPATAQVRKDLEWISNRIETLEGQRTQSKAVAEAMPEASMSARFFGSSEQVWRDFWTAIPLLFWMLARVIAMPLAAAAMTGTLRKPTEPRTAAKAAPATTVAPHPFAPVLRRPVAPEKAFQKPEEGTPSPVPVPGPSPKPLIEAAPVALEIDPTQFFEREMDKQNVVKFTTKQDRKKQRQKSKKNISEGDVTMWFQDCTTRVPEKDIAATSKECWESYQAWCQVNEYKPTSRKDLTRKMGIIWGRAAGSRGPRNADGAIWPGLKVVKPNAQPLRARA